MAEGPAKKERRKSLSVFSPSAAASPFFAPPAHDRSPSDDVHSHKKRSRRNSGFFGARNPSPVPDAAAAIPQSHRRAGTVDSLLAPNGTATPHDTLRPRRKSIQQKKRASVFGSLRSLHSLEDDNHSLNRSKAAASSVVDDDDGIGSMILHHGEVQTTGGMWRKKSQYLVLTETHLVRFKNQSKAADVFPSIPPSFARTAASRQSIASVSSLQDPHLAASSTDPAAGIPLHSIVAVYMLDDGRPSSTVEVAYLDDRAHKATFIQMQTPDLQELSLWMVGIRSAAGLARASRPLPFDPKPLECVTRMLEYERDYDPQTFRMFRVIQMASSKPSPTTARAAAAAAASASSDDLTKLSPTGCYLALGSHKLHLIPLHKIVTGRGSAVSLADLDATAAASFGLMNLTCLSMEWGDDSLHLTFRVPLRRPFSVFLASVHSLEIACWIRRQTEFLRPLWTRQPYDFIAPRDLQNDQNFPPVDLDEDYGCFDRTLVAYSASFDVDTSNIRYTVDDGQGEDAPGFRLLPPAGAPRQRYSPLELIAVMRTLRYNESFRSISFAGVSLDALQGVRDLHGFDTDLLRTRDGDPVHIPGQENLSLLSQEIRALALQSRWLRRLDFAYTSGRIPTADSESRDPGCGIPEALFPVCRREMTSVDWIVLTGIRLGDSDLDYLVDAASQRGSHLRALEVGHCGLSTHDLDLVLSTTVAQGATLEALNIAGVQGRLDPQLLRQYLGHFTHIRTLDMSRIARLSGTEPLLSAETLFHWRLEELALSRTALNRESVDALATYLASDRSSDLRVLRLDQCGLTGQDVALFLHSMARADGPRRLHLHVNENRLDLGCAFLCDAIAQDKAPTHLSMRMIDFKTEAQFRGLVEALRVNRTVTHLDIAKASLPADAGPETCRSLQRMFEENETLEDLDISGESAHLDVARFGIGLNLALTGLKRNRTLQVLRVEHQKLGLQGASTLSTVLEENRSLRAVHCENNDLNLQSFTVLVNGLQRNRTLLSLSGMEGDRARSLEKVRREVEGVKRDGTLGCSSSSSSATSAIRRSLQVAMTGGSSGKHATTGSRLTKPSSHPTGPLRRSGPSAPAHLAAAETTPFLHHDVEVILHALTQKWDAEGARLQRYLFRNYHLAHGGDGAAADDLTLDFDDGRSEGRPTTATSLATMLDHLKFEVTVSADEVASSPPTTDRLPPSPHPSDGSSDPNSLELDGRLDGGRRIAVDASQRPQTAPFAGLAGPAASTVWPGSGAAAGMSSSRRLAAPVSPLPATVYKTRSVRSARSSSTVSTSTGTAASARSAYGTASSTLKNFLTGSGTKERRRMEQMTTPAVCVSDEGPPQVDWTPPHWNWGE